MARRRRRPSRRRIRLTLLKLSDLSAILTAFAVATLLVVVPGQAIPLEEFLALRLKVTNFAIFLGLILFWHVGFFALGLYEDGRPAASRKSSTAILKATTLATLAASARASQNSGESMDLGFRPLRLGVYSRQPSDSA